jgi:hypothetical protein
VTTVGAVKCWGCIFTSRGSPHPVDMEGLQTGVEAVALGTQHICALTTAGGVKCSGNNSLGQLGDGTTTDSTTLVNVLGLASGAAHLAAGEHHTCAATTTGCVKRWGDNESGQLGDGTTTDSTTPVNVAGLCSQAVGGFAELPAVVGTGGSGMGSATYALMAGPAAGLLSFAVLATLSVSRWRVRWPAAGRHTG